MSVVSVLSSRAGLILFGILAAFALLATGSYVFKGEFNGGDLYQHHAAGELWSAGETHNLYRGNILGQRIDAWQMARFPDKTPEPRDQFNYLYPPLCAKLAASLAHFPFATWTVVWLGFSLFACVAALILAGRAFPGTWKNPLVLLAVAAFPPLHYALYIGQLTPLTLLIVAGACRLLTLDRPVWAGAVVSMLFYKPQLLPWLGLFMLLAGSWRFVAGAVGGSCLWLAVGVFFAGFQAHLDWLACLRDMAGGIQFTRPGVNLSLRGMLEFATGSGSTWTQGLAWLGGLVGIAGTALWHRKRAGSPASALALGTAVCQVLSPYVCHYDYLLVLPWMLAAASTARAGSPTPAASLLLLWVSGLLSIAGLLYGWPYSGLMLALWLGWTLWRVNPPQ